MSVPVLMPVCPVSKKRNDRSAKIDAWVLFMVETIVNWKRQTDPDSEKLTVAELLSETVRAALVDDFTKAKAWIAKQTDKGPTAGKTKPAE
jgi:hypothetical protein